MYVNRALSFLWLLFLHLLTECQHSQDPSLAILFSSSVLPGWFLSSGYALLPPAVMNLVHPSAELHTQVPDYLLGTSTCTACKQLKADMFELCSLPAWSSPCIPVLMNGAPAFWSTYVRGHPGVFAVSSLLFQPSILSPANCRPFSSFLLYSSLCRVTAGVSWWVSWVILPPQDPFQLAFSTAAILLMSFSA